MSVQTPNASANSSPPATEDPRSDDPRSAYTFTPAYESRSLVVEALARSKWIVLLLVVLLAGAGVAVGYKRKPVWTASSTLEVGANINPNSPGFSSFVQSAATLSTTFSREITANDVLTKIHNKTKLSPVAIAGRITATPIPDGAAIKVIATGPTPSSAINLANTAASALVAHEGANNFASSAPPIYREYQAQASVLAQARARVQRIQKKDSQAVIGSPNANSASDPALVQAQAALSSAQARADALSTAYTQAVAAQSSLSTNLVTPLASAVSATSDRTHKLELLGFIGLAAGFLIGAAIAILREQRRAHRIPHPQQ